MSPRRCLITLAVASASVAGGQSKPVMQGAAGGTSAAVLDSSSGIATASSLSAALSAQLPGVVVTPRGGAVGAGSHVWLRGPTGLEDNDVVLIIDGVRAISNQSSEYGSSTASSRLDDIDPAIIERIEVLRGIASAARYGSDASRGAILVTTRRADRSAPRWEAFAAGGVVSEGSRYPTNHGASGRAPDGVTFSPSCPLVAEATGTCVALDYTEWNPLERVSPFHTGLSTAQGIRLNGGARGWQLGGSIVRREAGGVRTTNGFESVTGAFSGIGLIRSGLTLELNGSHRYSRVDEPDETDPAIEGGLFGLSVDDPVDRGYQYPLSYQGEIERIRFETIKRTTAAAHLAWTARPWLTVDMTLGVDALRNHRGESHHVMLATPSVNEGTAAAATGRPYLETREVSGTARHHAGGLEMQTAIGYGRWKSHTRFEQFSGSGVPPAISVTTEDRRDYSTTVSGPFMRQRVSWGERLELGGAARLEQVRISGPATAPARSYSTDVLWRVVPGTEAGSPSRLALRAAWGEGGGAPTLIPESTFVIPPGQEPIFGQWELTGFHNPQWASEVEVGLDATLFSGRLTSQLTGYRGRARSVVGADTLSTYSGFDVRTSYTSRVNTRGIEAAFKAILVDAGPVTWELQLLGAAHGQRLLQGEQVDAFPGDAAVGSMWMPGYTFEDTDLDGRIAPNEVVVVSANRSDNINTGSPIPLREMVARTSHLVASRFRISAVIERREGQRRLNRIHQARCVSALPVCVEAFDPATSLEDQAAIAATGRSNAGYVERADFTRLREVSIAGALPNSVAHGVGARSARFTLTGTNLMTWTPYAGLDPEVSPTVVPASMVVQPLLRSVTLRVDMAWQRTTPR